MQESISESSMSSIPRIKKSYTMFPTDKWKSDILHWVITTRTTIKCQQTENPLSPYNSKQTKRNSKCKPKGQKRSEPVEIFENGNGVPCICKTNNRKCTKDVKLTTRCICTKKRFYTLKYRARKQSSTKFYFIPVN